MWLPISAPSSPVWYLPWPQLDSISGSSTYFKVAYSSLSSFSDREGIIAGSDLQSICTVPLPRARSSCHPAHHRLWWHHDKILVEFNLAVHSWSTKPPIEINSLSNFLAVEYAMRFRVCSSAEYGIMHLSYRSNYRNDTNYQQRCWRDIIYQQHCHGDTGYVYKFSSIQVPVSLLFYTLTYQTSVHQIFWLICDMLWVVRIFTSSLYCRCCKGFIGESDVHCSTDSRWPVFRTECRSYFT